MRRFGEKLRSLRKQRGMTLKELANLLGVSAHSYISKLEHGEKKPSVEMAIKISKVFDVSLDVLLRDDIDLEDGKG